MRTSLRVDHHRNDGTATMRNETSLSNQRKHLLSSFRKVAFGFFLGVCATRMTSFTAFVAYSDTFNQSTVTGQGAAIFSASRNSKVQNTTTSLTQNDETIQGSNQLQNYTDVDGGLSEQPLETTTASNETDIVDFERQPGVVITVKIQGPPHWPQLKQSLCLLNRAYNHRMNYDHLVFTTLPIREEDIKEVQALIAPANLTVVVDEKQTVQEHAELLNEKQLAYLLERCDVNSTDQLEWWTRCREEGADTMPIAYNWQSEFRSLHIWKQPALAKYRWMFWYDSDCMATRVWEQDPVAHMIREKLVILFTKFPGGKSRGASFQQRIRDSFNQSLCHIGMVNGSLVPSEGDCWDDTQILQINGFFHITDLDFYRSEIPMKWSKNLIGDEKFSRKYDDQIDVTVPAAILAPDRAREMAHAGINLRVWHNGHYDGKVKWRGGGYKAWWRQQAHTDFPEALGHCRNHIRDPGRL